MDEHITAEIIMAKILQSSSNRMVRQINVNVGEVSKTNYNRLFKMLSLLSQGTHAEDASIRFHHVPVSIRCNCGYSGEAPVFGPVEMPKVDCPRCGKGYNHEIAAGLGVNLKDIEF